MTGPGAWIDRAAGRLACAGAIAVACLAACGASARPLCAPTPQLPAAQGTAQGRVIAGYVAAFDSGDPAAMVAFLRAHRSSRAPAATAADLGADYRHMAGALGCLVPRALDPEGDGAVTLMVDTAREDRFALRFAFDGDRIRSIAGAPAFVEDRAASDAEAAAIVVRHADELAARDRFSGVIVLARDGVPFLARAWGLADRGRGVANTVDGRFHIASVGKMFTAVAVLQLVAAGKLRLDDRVDRFVALPAGPAITIAQLLTHTSGLVDDYPAFQRERTRLRMPADYVARFAAQPLAFPPGRSARYSNFGYTVLARVVELAAGEPFEAYLRDHVFAPAGMTTVDFDPAAVPGRAIPYAGERALVDATPQLPVRGNGYGCEYATADDLLRFVTALMADRLLPARETAQMLTNQLTPAMHVTGGITAYGYGAIVNEIAGQRVVGHDGGAPGVSAFVRTLPALGYTVVVLANRDGAAARIGPRALRLLARSAAR